MKKLLVRILILAILVCVLLAIGSGTSVLAERIMDEWAQQIVIVQPADDGEPAETGPVVGAELIVANQTIGGDRKFEFHSATLGAFWLTTIDGLASTKFSDLAPGTYDVVEGVPPNWRLAGATCSDGSDLSRVELASGETVICTFTNVKEGTIIVNKETVNDTATFNFGGDLGAFKLTTIDGIASTEFSGLAPGTYDVEELAGPFNLTGISCLDPTFDSSVSARSASVTLAAGETVECTFSNGTVDLPLAVAAEPADDEAAAFDFGGLMAAAGPLTPDRSTATATAGFDVDPEPGDTEALPERDDGEDPINIACLGGIIVEKQTDPDGAPDSFTFTGNAAGSISDGQQIVVSGLLPGTYTSSEDVPPGWTLDNISCDDNNSSGSGNTATFNLEAGETVKCTFTNRTDLPKRECVCEVLETNGRVWEVEFHVVEKDDAGNEIRTLVGIDGNAPTHVKIIEDDFDADIFGAIHASATPDGGHCELHPGLHYCEGKHPDHHPKVWWPEGDDPHIIQFGVRTDEMIAADLEYVSGSNCRLEYMPEDDGGTTGQYQGFIGPVPFGNETPVLEPGKAYFDMAHSVMYNVEFVDGSGHTEVVFRLNGQEISDVTTSIFQNGEFNQVKSAEGRAITTCDIGPTKMIAYRYDSEQARLFQTMAGENTRWIHPLDQPFEHKYGFPLQFYGPPHQTDLLVYGTQQSDVAYDESGQAVLELTYTRPGLVAVYETTNPTHELEWISVDQLSYPITATEMVRYAFGETGLYHYRVIDNSGMIVAGPSTNSTLVFDADPGVAYQPQLVYPETSLFVGLYNDMKFEHPTHWTMPVDASREHEFEFHLDYHRLADPDLGNDHVRGDVVVEALYLLNGTTSVAQQFPYGRHDGVLPGITLLGIPNVNMVAFCQRPGVHEMVYWGGWEAESYYLPERGIIFDQEFYDTWGEEQHNGCIDAARRVNMELARQGLRTDHTFRHHGEKSQGYQMAQLNIWSPYNLGGMRPPHIGQFLKPGTVLPYYEDPSDVLFWGWDLEKGNLVDAIGTDELRQYILSLGSVEYTDFTGIHPADALNTPDLLSPDRPSPPVMPAPPTPAPPTPSPTPVLPTPSPTPRPPTPTPTPKPPVPMPTPVPPTPTPTPTPVPVSTPVL